MRGGISLADLQEPSDGLGRVAPIPLVFTPVNDLSASCSVVISGKPIWATRLFVNLGWVVTLGNEAIGALKAVILGDPAATAGADYSKAMLSPAGANGGNLFAIDLEGAPAVKLVYTRTSGSGTWAGADSTGTPSYYWSA